MQPTRALHRALFLPSNKASPMLDAETKRLAKRIGAVCRKARIDFDCTQRDVADSAGINRESYARIERGQSMPSIPTLLAIAEELGLSLDKMLGRKSGNVLDTNYQPRILYGLPRHVRRAIPLLRNATPAAMRIVVALLKHPDMHVKTK